MNPQTSQWLGYGKVHIEKKNLVLAAGVRSPSYSSRGLLLTEESTSWTTQELDLTEYLDMKRRLWPSHVFSEMYRTVSAVARLQICKIKDAFGIDLSHEDKHIRSYFAGMKRIVDEAEAEADAELGAQSTKQPGASTAIKTLLEEDMENPVLLSLCRLGDALGVQDRWALGNNETLGLMGMSLMAGLSPQPEDIMVLSGDLGNPVVPPKCVRVFGMVVVKGPAMKLWLNIEAAYDPKEAKVKHVTGKVVARAFI